MVHLRVTCAPARVTTQRAAPLHQHHHGTAAPREILRGQRGVLRLRRYRLVGAAENLSELRGLRLGQVVETFDLDPTTATGGPVTVAVSLDGTAILVGWASDSEDGTDTFVRRIRCDG